MTAPDALSGALPIRVAGEELILLSQRAVWWPDQDTVLVADLHWGKAAAFRAVGVPVPRGTTDRDLARLSIVLDATRARHLVILGDLLHARTGRHDAVFASVATWRARHGDVDMLLVRGNHDRHAGDPPDTWDIVCCHTPWQQGPFAGVHEPEPHPSHYVLSGHLHPNVTVLGRGRQRVRVPTYVFGPQVGILPAFSAFTGGGAYEPRVDDRLYAIAGDEVLPLEARVSR